jgi:site-specific recombinase XerD
VSDSTFQNHGVAALLEKFLKNREFLRGNRPATLRFYAEKLEAFKCFLGDRQEITKNAVEDFLTYLCRKDAKGNSRNKPGAVNCYLRAIRVFFNWCVEEEYLNQSPAQKVKYLKGEHKLVRVLSLSDQQKILAEIKLAERNPGSHAFAL